MPDMSEYPATLKSGVNVLGIFECCLFVLSILGAIFGSYGGNVPDYQIITTYVRPIIVELPQVVMFVLLLTSGMSYKARRNYYRTRFVCLIISILVSIIYTIGVYMLITNDYKIEYCNARGDKNRR